MKKFKKKLLEKCRRRLVIASLALLAAVLAAAIYAAGFWSGLSKDAAFEIGGGAAVSKIAGDLKAVGIIKSETMFKAIVIGFGGRAQKGVYDIPAGSGMWRVARMMARGDIAATTVVIPEGMTVRQIYQALERNQFLRGAIECAECAPGGSDAAARADGRPAPGTCQSRGSGCYRDGDLFPDTYRVAKGTPRTAVLDLMRKNMLDLEKGWNASGRHAPAPLRNWNEVMTLASIVQKETPRVSEMPVVASVYLNRLRKKMKLQADPTVVYAITGGLGDMRGRALLTGHLKTESAYNTYARYGLPPHPIANVGRDAIQAVLNPADTNYYFFVADGTGGHAFAKDFKEHTANRASWREIKKKIGKAANAANGR